MKFLTFFIIVLCILQSWGIIIKQNQTNLLAQKSAKTNTQRRVNLKEYSKEILKEINEYRKQQHYFPRIRWQNVLASTAYREARSIISKNSFGQHQNFKQWNKRFKNKYFTELALQIDTEGQISPKQIFAKTILESLKDDQEWYLMHGYNYGGVSMLRTRKRNNYIVVIHLARKHSKGRRGRFIRHGRIRRIRRPTRFTSCKQARRYGSRSRYSFIYPRGRKYRVECDQHTAGGGWTRISYRTLYYNKRAVRIGISDLNLKYSQVLFETLPGYFMDYATQTRNQWKFDGYAFPLNALKFNNVWYVCSVSNTYKSYRNRLRHKYYNINDRSAVRILKRGGRCNIGSRYYSQYCAKKFILSKLPRGRLNQISDIESLFRFGYSNNKWKARFKIFVR